MLTSSTAAFSWLAGSGVTERYLTVGTTPDGGEIYARYQGSARSRMVTGLPTNGSTIYVRLSSWINGAWLSSSCIYTAFR